MKMAQFVSVNNEEKFLRTLGDLIVTTETNPYKGCIELTSLKIVGKKKKYHKIHKCKCGYFHVKNLEEILGNHYKKYIVVYNERYIRPYNLPINFSDCNFYR
tara:strand:+ start:333 stop:638 length:306 start_codon:yes stop_codon:yes gene_type:complete